MKTMIHQIVAMRWFGLPMALYLAGFAASLPAAPRSEREVTAAVETWLQSVITDSRLDAAIEKIEPHAVDGGIVAYIAHLKGGGYCLCGADDLVLPVYLYSPQGRYDPDSPHCHYILWEISTRTDGLRTGIRQKDPGLALYQQQLADRLLLWNDLVARQVPARRAKAAVAAQPDKMELSFTPLWGQGSPYNDRCPILPGPPNAGRTLVGCVATAMSQIMYYWRWPNTGTGEHQHDYEYRQRPDWDTEPLATNPAINAGTWAGRLQWSAGGGGQLQMTGNWDASIYASAQGISPSAAYANALATLYDGLEREVSIRSANFGNTTYNWNLMQDVHTDPPDEGDFEAATLSYHTGIALDMGWGLWSSNSSTSNVADVLEDYFRYDPDATYGNRNKATMTAEIQWLRPLQIRASDVGGAGGHSWVVYGYDKATDPNRSFLMNFGWSGSSDAWYTLDNVNPGALDLNLGQAHITRIAPLNVVRFAGGSSGGDGSPSAPYEDVRAAVDAAADGTTLILKAGSTNTFAGGSLVIDRPLTLKGYGVLVLHE